MPAYSSIISLGGNCEIAHQIRRHFGSERAYPFDWWITPLEAVAKLFREGPEVLFDTANLDPGDRRLAVRCSATGIFHHHDFQRDEDGLVVPELIAAQLDDLRQKFKALWLRLDETCVTAEKILFVRGWCDILHYPDHAPKHAKTQLFDFASVLAAIAGRYPALDFEVLFANYGDAHLDDERALFLNIDYEGPVDWRGSDTAWDRAYAQLGATLIPTA